MRRPPSRPRSTRRALGVVAALLFCVVTASYARRAHAPIAAARHATQRDSVLAFLRDWVRNGADGRETLGSGGDADQQTFVIAAPLEPSPAGRPAWIAQLSGAPWCGSGGCQTLVVTHDDSTRWHIISDIGVSRLPVIVLRRTRHDRPDFVVNTSSANRSEWALVRFDGRRYVEAPFITSRVHPPGRVVLVDTMRLALLDSLAPVDSLKQAWLRRPPVHWTGLAGDWTLTVPSRDAVIDATIGETPAPDAVRLPTGWPALVGSGVLHARGRRWPLRCVIGLGDYATDSLDVVDTTRRDLSFACAIPTAEGGDQVLSFWTTVPSSGTIPASFAGRASWIPPWATGPVEWDPRPATAMRRRP